MKSEQSSESTACLQKSLVRSGYLPVKKTGALEKLQHVSLNSCP